MGSIHIFCSRLTTILIIVVSAIVGVANLFLGNILVYEATTKLKFDWNALLHSYVFWIVVGINLLYHTFKYCYKRQERVIDDRVSMAFDDNIIDLMKAATEAVKRGDYDTAKRVQKALKQCQKQKRRRR